MKNQILFFTILLSVLGIQVDIFGQGCVAVRPMNCSSGGQISSSGILSDSQWELSANYQYFKSFRHFRGAIEEHERIENGTQVINISHAINFNVGTALTDRLGVTLSVPLLFYDRSSLYEHYGNRTSSNPEQKRFHTDAQGLGDMRVVMNYWLLDPAKSQGKGNISLGAGIKLPTGNSNVEGTFHKLDQNGNDSLTYRPVDQSIQLGDGGWGAVLEAQGFWKLFDKTFMYFNGFYLLNPQEQNNTLTRGRTTGVDPTVTYHSIPDQYSARLGLNYSILPMAGLSVNLGARVEGVPSHDLIGGSEGYRRPGHIFSIEPGISYSVQNINLNLGVPFALYRNRVKSVYDLSDASGQRHGDAAFADYLVSFTFSYRWGGMSHSAMEHDMEM